MTDYCKYMLRVSNISKPRETSQNEGQRPLSEGQRCSDKEEAGSGDWDAWARQCALRGAGYSPSLPTWYVKRAVVVPTTQHYLGGFI